MADAGPEGPKLVEIQGVSKHFKYADLGTSWEYKERNAFFGTVSASSK